MNPSNEKTIGDKLMVKDIVIVGSSGFAREIRWLIERINEVEKKWNFLGFVDSDLTKKDVIYNDDILCAMDKDLDVIIAIADPHLRKKLADKYRINKHLHFPNIIDPSVVMSDKIKLGEGNIICAYCILTVDVELNNFDIVNLTCTIGHEAVLKDYVTLNPNTNVSGNVLLGEGAVVGTGTQIIQGKILGQYSVVGAGAVVIEDIPELCIAVGVPTKIVKDRR